MLKHSIISDILTQLLQYCCRIVGVSLCQTASRDNFCPPFLSPNYAHHKSIQKLWILLGVCCLRSIPRQPSVVHGPKCDSSICCCRTLHSKTLYLLSFIISRMINYSYLNLQISELGNLSIHLLLRDLRPPGSTVRAIPYPNSNPLTQLFRYVSCPNYTYEFYAWLSFTVMTQCLPGRLMFKVLN